MSIILSFAWRQGWRLRLLKRNIPTGLYLYIQTGWYVVKRRREEKFLRMKNQNKSMI
jgi:hypothetical protein